jgi:RNA polymerase sigma-70 factor (ECF subfamily)
VDESEATQLWERFRLMRDSDAFERLYRAYYAHVYRAFRGAFGSDSVADELTIEVFYRLGSNPQEARKGFKAMLFSWVSRLCQRHRSGDGRGRQPLGLPDAPEPPDVPEAGDGGASESDAALERALARLPDEERLVFVLRTIPKLSFDAIAEMLGVSRRTVCRMYSQAVQRLKRILGDP